MEGVIFTSYFTKKKHPNDVRDRHVVGRQASGYVKNNNFSYIRKWYYSINDLGIQAVIFHDDLSSEFVDKYTTSFVSFVKVKDSYYSNNDYRFFCFMDYLVDKKFDWVFHADVSDVVIVKNPTELIFEYKDYRFFACSNAPVKLHNFGNFLSFHTFMKWDGYSEVLVNSDWELINMGVVGGRYKDMCDFYKSFCEIRESAEPRFQKAGTPYFNCNMYICQYLLRIVFQHRLTLIGDPVTSKFKRYEYDRNDVWFIHK